MTLQHKTVCHKSLKQNQKKVQEMLATYMFKGLIFIIYQGFYRSIRKRQPDRKLSRAHEEIQEEM